eukprot:13923755-Alexandrium_andersonii.AAC.1
MLLASRRSQEPSAPTHTSGARLAVVLTALPPCRAPSVCARSPSVCAQLALDPLPRLRRSSLAVAL